MKALARSYIWWHHLDNELENKVKGCHEYQVTQKAPPVAPLHPWEFPKKLWSCIHIDYAGPFMGHMFLIMSSPLNKFDSIGPSKAKLKSLNFFYVPVSCHLAKW